MERDLQSICALSLYTMSATGLDGFSVPQSFVQYLQNPAVGNLFLLLASILGVFGSYFLYTKRRADSRNSLRRALAQELYQLEQINDASQNLQNLSNGPPGNRLSSSSVPPSEVFPTTVYEANAANLGLLPDQELEKVVDFYTTLLQHKGIIQGIRDGNRDVPMPDHEKIVDEFPELVEKRETLLQSLDQNLDRQN